MIETILITNFLLIRHLFSDNARLTSIQLDFTVKFCFPMPLPRPFPSPHWHRMLSTCMNMYDTIKPRPAGYIKLPSPATPASVVTGTANGLGVIAF